MAKGDRIGNRKTREQRRTIKVPELGYYLIVTDTEGTERCFFTGLHQSLPEEVKNKLVIKVVETKTRSMIDKCLELTAYEAQYRIPWIVFDRDQVIGFDEIISEAEKKGIQVGWSNPCFEIWMYTYFGAMPAIQDSWTCCSEFGRVYESKTGQKYSKADEKMYGKISNAGNEEKAIQIAQQKLEQCEREGNVFASEILMPTEWVKEMLTLNENRSLEYNIKQLCTIANTSIMACFYALENAMKSGNVIVVSGDMFFPKKFISDRRMTLYFQGYDEYDVWDDLCLCKEEFDIGNYQVCHYVFPECPSMEQIETAFSTTENVVSALELIFGNDFSAWCCWMGVVLNQISHIYNAYLFAKNECVKHYKNEKSLMQLYYSDKLDLMNECKLFEYDFYEVNFGNDWTMVLIKEPCYVIDKKVSYSDSRLLIKEILSEMYTDDKNIKKASYRINGIIGSALSHRETMTKEEIYNLLNIKLRRSDIAEFVFHRKFEKFIYSKSVEKSL